jgi:hypothetical protein
MLVTVKDIAEKTGVPAEKIRTLLRKKFIPRGVHQWVWNDDDPQVKEAINYIIKSKGG